jgi:hypothetical protein
VLQDTGGINLNDGLFLTGSNSTYYNWSITNGWVGIGYTNFPTAIFTTNWNVQSLGVPVLAGWVTLGANGQPPGYYGPTNLFWGGPTGNDAAFNTNVNPVVARIAVWIDADACKINLNTAGYRDAASTNRSVPRDIDLRALEAPFANAGIANISTLTAQALTTPEELRRYTAGWLGSDANDFARNKFSLSVAGGDANVDAFGRARLDLNSITSVPTDPSAWAPFNDATWASMLYGAIITDTNRNTIVKKYGRFGARQILANIVDYQRPATASATMSGRDGDAIPMTYCGLKKGPMINAVIVHVSTNQVPNTTNLAVNTYIDVKLVNGYDRPRGYSWVLKIEPESIAVDCSRALGGATQSVPVTNRTYVCTNAIPANSYGLLGAPTGDSLDLGPDVLLSASGFSLILTNNDPSTNILPSVSRVNVKLKSVRLLMDGGGDDRIVDWMAPIDFSNQTAGVGFDFRNGGRGNIVSDPPTFKSNGQNPANFMPIALVKQDPRVRTFTGFGVIQADTFANSVNNRLWENWMVYPYNAGTNSYQVAADTTDFYYDSRLSPTVYGLLADTRGTNPVTAGASQRFFFDDIGETNFQSVGELAYIHTGYPWRTLRFRSVVPHTTNVTNNAQADYALTSANYGGIGDPNDDKWGIETNALPDWIMLDMFTATNATSVAGKININGAIHGETVYLPQYAFSINSSKGYGNFVSTTNTMAARLPPIRALLANTSGSLTTSSTALDTIAGNILNRTFVTNSPYASTTGNRPPAYLTPGEICEVAGLGYFNDVAWHPSSADREQAIRRIGELVTTRSDTFTIWAVAQVIKERRFWDKVYDHLTEPDGRVDWVWFHPSRSVTPPFCSGFVDGDGDEDVLYLHEKPDYILAEVRMQTVVQRYIDGTGKVCFRTLYTRYWSE